MKRMPLAVALLLLLVLGGSASAKPGHGRAEPMILHATIDGPGIVAPLRIEAAKAYQLATDTGMRVLLERFLPANALSPPVPEDLGPGYAVEFRLSDSYARAIDRDDPRIEQIVYPFAAGRPWAFTPRGQNLMVHGWMPVTMLLLDHLETYGLPSEAPPAHGAVSDEPSGSWDRPLSAWMAIFLAAGLAGVAFLSRRARRANERPHAVT